MHSPLCYERLIEKAKQGGDVAVVLIQLHQGVNDGGIGLQQHLTPQPVVKNAADVVSLILPGGFLFDDAGQGEALSMV